MTQLKIKDLIEVPEVKTVIQLADIDDPELRDFLTDSFLITDEVSQILDSFFTNITNSEGKGYFIEGNFGSGKSHLLSVLSLLLTYSEAWESLLNQEGENSSLQQLAAEIKKQKYIVINLSLVEHSNKEYLEDIVLNGIVNFLENEENPTDLIDKQKDQFEFSGEAEFVAQIARLVKEDYPDRLKSFLREENITADQLFQSGNLYLIERLIERLNLPYRFNYNRQDIFARLSKLLNADAYQGMVILIDELSEFLRSKPDGRRFNEDIRFLQFLGEFTRKSPCWVLATLQEEIERTGETTPEAFNKIKDRYPVRFHLTGEHIKELISKRLIRHREGSIAEIEEIFRYYRNSFPQWTLSRRDFLDLYPVNPLAIDLLDNLKPLFSQHRGIIDFIHYQLKGDPARKIKGMMESPANQLLTPDQIFDHFTDRIREMMETSPYYEKVYKYYQQEIASLLTEDQVNIGLKLVKLLILFNIAPIGKKYTVREMANMLLYQVTELEPRVNYEFINDILERLYSRGAYLVREEVDDVLAYRYFIDLEADINLIIKRRTNYIESNLFADDSRLFTRLGKQVKEAFLPLASLFTNPRSKRNISWQNTNREGFVYFLPLEDISLENINQAADRLSQTEEDFMFFIGYAHQTSKSEKYLKEVLLPELTDEQRQAFVFWLPTELTDSQFLTKSLSRILLLDEYADDQSTTGQEVKQRLKELIADDRDRISKIFRDAYFQGQLINGFGEVIIELSDMGFLPFPRFIEEVISQLLTDRFPDHVKIAPYQKILTTAQIDELLSNFLTTGEIADFNQTDGRVLNVVNNFLAPMGLIEKRKQGIRLRVKPDKNLLIKRFFALLQEEKTAVDSIYWQLRKGSYGLEQRQFKLLVYTLLFSGYLTAFSENQKISLQRLTARNFNRIKYIGYGELIGNEFQEIILDCSLIPPRLKNQPFSLPLQQQIWDYLIDQKKDLVVEVNQLKIRLQELKNEGIIEFDLANIREQLDKIDLLLSEIKVSYSSEEGIERFAAQYRSLPHIDSYLDRMAKIKDFFNHRLNDYRRIEDYLKNPQLVIPAASKYQGLRNMYLDLTSSLKDQTLLFSEDYFREFNQGFAQFHQQYNEYYLDEHSKQLAADRFRPYLKIKNSESYQVLAQLANLKLISVKDDLVKVDRLIFRALRRQCNALSGRQLKENPACSCGFNLGEKVELPPIEEIQQTIQSGILQYLSALKKSENQDKILTYLDRMEAVGEKRFARPIRELLNLKTGPKLLTEMKERLNRNLITRINQALAGDVTLVDRDLDRLYENLIGRSFSPEQLKQIFQEWLEGKEGISTKTYIRITSADSHQGNRGQVKNNPEETNELESFLDDYYPELLPLYDLAGSYNFSLLIALFHWKINFELEDQDVFTLIGEFLSGNIDQLIANLKDNSALINSFADVVRILYRRENSKADNRFLKIINLICRQVTGLMNETNIADRLIEKLSLKNGYSIIKAIDKEQISAKNIRKLIVLLIQLIEGRKFKHGQIVKLLSELKQLVDYKQFMLIEQNQNLTNLETQRSCCLQFLFHYLKLKLNSYQLEANEKPRSFREWESTYQNMLTGLENSLFQVEYLAELLQLEDRLPLNELKQQINRLYHFYQDKFKAFYDSQQLMVAETEANDYSSGNKDSEFLSLTRLLDWKYPALLKTLGAEKGLCLLLDGMRWDIWYILKTILNRELRFRVIAEGSHLAYQPTNTEKQIEMLTQAGFKGDIIKAKGFSGNEINHKKSSNFRDSNGLAGISRIIKFSFIDDKIHTSKDDYLHLVEEIIFQAENRLVPFLTKIKTGTPVLLFADHGFKINYNFNQAEKYETPRYLHGGSSLEEMIVPWALLYPSQGI